MKHAFHFALPFMLASLAAAQAIGPVAEPAEERQPDPLFRVEHGWHGFEKGAWVEMRITRREGDKRTERTERRTLRGIEKDGTAMVSVLDLAKPAEPILQSVEDVGVPATELDFESNSSVENGGLRRRCIIYSNARSEESKKTGVMFRLWVGTYVPTPGSVLVSEIRHADGSKITREVEDFDRFVEIGGRRVMGTPFREVVTLPNETGLTGTEELESPDVPGGVVSRSGKGWVLRDGVKVDFETEEIATAFGEDASDIDVKTRRACDDVRALFRYMPSAWKGFAVGSSTVTRSESRQGEESRSHLERTTVRAVKDAGWVMESETLEEWHKAGEAFAKRNPGQQEMTWNSSDIRWARVNHLGSETVKSCGKEWPCEIFSVVIPSPAAGDAGALQEQILEYRVWRCSTFPVNDGVVRRDFGWGRRGKETVMTETQTVVDLDRKCRIGTTDYPCFVFKTVDDDDKADSLFETERWICPGVPGGQVRQEGWRTVGGKRASTGVWEVIEVEVKKP